MVVMIGVTVVCAVFGGLFALDGDPIKELRESGEARTAVGTFAVIGGIAGLFIGFAINGSLPVSA